MYKTWTGYIAFQIIYSEEDRFYLQFQNFYIQTLLETTSKIKN